MNKWHQTSVGEFVDFNPPEKITKGAKSRKIPMDKLGVFQRKINGSEFSDYSAGPKFRNGDTLVAKITPCLENGKTAFVDILEENEVAFGSSEFIVLRENEQSDKRFIYYLARSPLFREKAISCMEGTSGRKRVNEGALKRQEILVPDIPSQQKIASVLSALDDKIEMNNKINTELEAMSKTLYDYWFVQFDFPDTEGKPYKSSGGEMVYDEVLKREIPKRWEVKDLSDIESNIVTGKTPSTSVAENFNGIVPFICIGDVRGTMHIIKTEITLSQAGANSQHNKYIPEGAICVTCIASPGLVGFATKASQTNQQLNSVVCKNKENRYFLYFYLTDYFKFSSAKTGNTFANMNKGDFSSIPVVKPDKVLLLKFSETLESSINKILNNSKQNQKLASLRDWLLPMLMNGQVTVVEGYNEVEENLGMVADGEVKYGK
jgi:type I restriction enzyme S subunit